MTFKVDLKYENKKKTQDGWDKYFEKEGYRLMSLADLYRIAKDGSKSTKREIRNIIQEEETEEEEDEGSLLTGTRVKCLKVLGEFDFKALRGSLDNLIKVQFTTDKGILVKGRPLEEYCKIIPPITLGIAHKKEDMKRFDFKSQVDFDSTARIYSNIDYFLDEYKDKNAGRLIRKLFSTSDEDKSIHQVLDEMFYCPVITFPGANQIDKYGNFDPDLPFWKPGEKYSVEISYGCPTIAMGNITTFDISNKDSFTGGKIKGRAVGIKYKGE